MVSEIQKETTNWISGLHIYLFDHISLPVKYFLIGTIHTIIRYIYIITYLNYSVYYSYIIIYEYQSRYKNYLFGVLC